MEAALNNTPSYLDMLGMKQFSFSDKALGKRWHWFHLVNIQSNKDIWYEFTPSGVTHISASSEKGKSVTVKSILALVLGYMLRNSDEVEHLLSDGADYGCVQIGQYNGNWITLHIFRYSEIYYEITYIDGRSKRYSAKPVPIEITKELGFYTSLEHKVSLNVRESTPLVLIDTEDKVTSALLNNVLEYNDIIESKNRVDSKIDELLLCKNKLENMQAMLAQKLGTYSFIDYNNVLETCNKFASMYSLFSVLSKCHSKVVALEPKVFHSASYELDENRLQVLGILHGIMSKQPITKQMFRQTCNTTELDKSTQMLSLLGRLPLVREYTFHTNVTDSIMQSKLDTALRIASVLPNALGHRYEFHRKINLANIDKLHSSIHALYNAVAVYSKEYTFHKLYRNDLDTASLDVLNILSKHDILAPKQYAFVPVVHKCNASIKLTAVASVLSRLTSGYTLVQQIQQSKEANRALEYELETLRNKLSEYESLFTDTDTLNSLQELYVKLGICPVCKRKYDDNSGDKCVKG